MVDFVPKMFQSLCSCSKGFGALSNEEAPCPRKNSWRIASGNWTKKTTASRTNSIKSSTSLRLPKRKVKTRSMGVTAWIRLTLAALGGTQDESASELIDVYTRSQSLMSWLLRTLLATLLRRLGCHPDWYKARHYWKTSARNSIVDRQDRTSDCG